MITGLIAAVIIIAMIACAGNGEWGSFWVGAVIVAALVIFWAVGKQSDRAYNNFVDYWANGGDGRRRNSKAEQERKQAFHERYVEEERAKRNDPSYVGGLKTAGAVQQVQKTEHPCPVCGRMMSEFSRIEYSSGAVFVTYQCSGCGKELPVKVSDRRDERR